MKVKQKKVYYCDFCGKHSLRSLEKHEKHCTANPHRICRMCGRIDIDKVIPKYQIEIKPEWFKEPNTIDGMVKVEIDKMVAEKIKSLKEEVGNCPMCVLTVIRLNKYKFPVEVQYDYKEEVKKYWEQRNVEIEDF